VDTGVVVGSGIEMTENDDDDEEKL
jgi:hypothetical protein